MRLLTLKSDRSHPGLIQRVCSSDEHPSPASILPTADSVFKMTLACKSSDSRSSFLEDHKAEDAGKGHGDTEPCRAGVTEKMRSCTEDDRRQTVSEEGIDGVEGGAEAWSSRKEILKIGERHGEQGSGAGRCRNGQGIELPGRGRQSQRGHERGIEQAAYRQNDEDVQSLQQTGR